MTNKSLDFPPIPLGVGNIDGWKNIPIKDDATDPLVPLGPLSGEADTLATSSIYFGEHSSSPYAKKENKLRGSLLTLFARRSVAKRLLAAEQLLPAGYHLLVLDAYRPYDIQKSLYDFYKQKLSQKHPNMSDDALATETQKYVSLPSTNPTCPSPHSTGGVVDVVIIRHATMLEFGTPFDHGGEKSALLYYESKIAAGETLDDKEREAAANRRLLFYVMTRVGFQPYFAEWWHFNAPESQMGAAAAGLDSASFGAAQLTQAAITHENMRRKMWQKHPTPGGVWPTEIIAPT